MEFLTRNLVRWNCANSFDRVRKVDFCPHQSQSPDSLSHRASPECLQFSLPTLVPCPGISQMLNCSWVWHLGCASTLTLAFPTVLGALDSACLYLKQCSDSVARTEAELPALCMASYQVRSGLGSWRTLVCFPRVWDRASGTRDSWSFQRLEAVLPSLLSFQSPPAPWVCVLLNAKDQSPFNVEKKRRPCSQPPHTWSAELNSITCTFHSCSFSCLSWKYQLARKRRKLKKKKKTQEVSQIDF